MIHRTASTDFDRNFCLESCPTKMCKEGDNSTIVWHGHYTRKPIMRTRRECMQARHFCSTIVGASSMPKQQLTAIIHTQKSKQEA